MMMWCSLRFFNRLSKTWAKNVTECFEPPILSNMAMGPSGSRVWVNFIWLVSFSALTTVYSVPFTDLAYRTALYSSNSGTSGKGLGRAYFWTLFRLINSTRVGGFRVFLEFGLSFFKILLVFWVFSPQIPWVFLAMVFIQWKIWFLWVIKNVLWTFIEKSCYFINYIFAM